jgi:hypothetical protein
MNRLAILVSHGLLGMSIVLPAFGQTANQAIQQNLLQREQQQTELSLKIQQSQQLLLPQPAPAQRDALSRLQQQQLIELRAAQTREQQRQLEAGQSAQPQGEPQLTIQLETQRALQARERNAQLLQFERELNPPPLH